MNLSTSTNILYERTDGRRIPVRESIRLCAQAGYREMDFCFVDQVFAQTEFIGDGWRDYLLDIRAYAEKLGVRFTQSHGALYDFCNQGPLGGEFARKMVCRSLEGSALLGVPWVVVHPVTKVVHGMVAPETEEENVTYFRQLARQARQLGVGIAIENMWGYTREGLRQYTVDPEEYFRLLDALPPGDVGACWDVEHGSIEGIDQPYILHRLGPRLKALHVSDQTSEKNIHILPYMGETNWEPILQALADIGYDRSFTYEIQHYLLRMPPELFPEAISLSYRVGMHMLAQIQQYKKK